jgi:hypothetical protein
MRVTHIDQCSDPGDRINEDIVGARGDLAWVLDGSRSLSGGWLVDETSDPRWFVHAWDEYLRSRADDPDAPLIEIVRGGVHAVSERFLGAAGPGPHDPLDLPSCAGVILRHRPGGGEAFILGDCTLIYREAGGEARRLTDDRITTFDSAASDAIQRLQSEEGSDFATALESVLPLLRENRMKKNTRDGYWILGFEPEAVDHGVYEEWNWSGETTCLLMSDGFSRLFDTYGIVEDQEKLLGMVVRDGVETALKRLRDAESGDPECLRFPRLKVADDASALLVTLAP